MRVNTKAFILLPCHTNSTLWEKGNAIIAATPWGNTMTAEVAKLALENYGLGSDNITDFLAVSFHHPTT